MTTTQRLKDMVGWGVALWLAGYVLGIVLFFVVPPAAIGWIIMPVGVALTLAVLSRVRAVTLADYLATGFAWTAIAVAGDYLFIVRLFHPPDGYYKPDVYAYYVTTFVLPPAVGWWRHPGRA